MRLTPVLLFCIFTATLAYADDLVTRDGKVYHGYKVLGHDAGFVTIMYSDGGGKIPLSNLPDDLQKKYGYDKAAADAFVQASIAQNRKDQQAVAREQQQHEAQVAAQASAPEAAPPPPRPVPASATASAAPGNNATATQVAPTGMTQDEIDAIVAKIAALTSDSTDMEYEAQSNGGLKNSSNHAFRDQIKEDGSEIAQLNAQLIKESLSSNPPLTLDDRKDMETRIDALTDESVHLTRAIKGDPHGSMQTQLTADAMEIDQLRKELRDGHR